MKNIYLTISSFFIGLIIFAQSPQKMSYQAVIRDASGSLITNQNIGMSISIRWGSASGPVDFSEVHSATTNSNGLVSLQIGTGSSQQGTISDIYWGDGPYFIETQTDPNGGNNYTISGSSELLSVPYALTSPPFVRTDDNTYSTNSTIGIGIANPWSRLDIMDTLDPATSYFTNVDDFTIYVDAFSVSTDPNKHHTGTYSTINAISGAASGVYGYSHGLNPNDGQNAGVFGEAVNGGDNFGIYGRAVETNTGTSSILAINNGAGGEAANSSETNIGGAFLSHDDADLGADNYGVAGFADNDQVTLSLGINYGGIFESGGSLSSSAGIYASTQGVGQYDYAAEFNGDVLVTGTLYETSDRKFKTNITKMNNAMSILRKIEPVEYDYNQSFLEKGLNLPKEHQFGFIAQDLENILPNAVAKQKIYTNMSKRKPGEERVFEEFLGVNYKSIIPILVQGIKEQDKKINELEMRIKELEKLIK
jgi:hypothetical protein